MSEIVAAPPLHFVLVSCLAVGGRDGKVSSKLKTQKPGGVHHVIQLGSGSFVSCSTHPISLDARGKRQCCLAGSALLFFSAMSSDVSRH